MGDSNSSVSLNIESTRATETVDHARMNINDSHLFNVTTVVDCRGQVSSIDKTLDQTLLVTASIWQQGAAALHDTIY
jgi:hypothetical protein